MAPWIAKRRSQKAVDLPGALSRSVRTKTIRGGPRGRRKQLMKHVVSAVKSDSRDARV